MKRVESVSAARQNSPLWFLLKGQIWVLKAASTKRTARTPRVLLPPSFPPSPLSFFYSIQAVKCARPDRSCCWQDKRFCRPSFFLTRITAHLGFTASWSRQLRGLESPSLLSFKWLSASHRCCLFQTSRSFPPPSPAERRRVINTNQDFLSLFFPFPFPCGGQRNDRTRHSW